MMTPLPDPAPPFTPPQFRPPLPLGFGVGDSINVAGVDCLFFPPDNDPDVADEKALLSFDALELLLILPPDPGGGCCCIGPRSLIWR